jgi:hypothetical protein
VAFSFDKSSGPVSQPFYQVIASLKKQTSAKLVLSAVEGSASQ